jgi:nitrous oxide reductase accessory protein NosL
MKKLFLIVLGGFSLLLMSCSQQPDTGPADVRWDRDTCERCRMVLSDHYFAAQIRYFPEGKRSRVIKFDDMGCAVIWLEDKQWKNDGKTEIWVADYESGDWLDARSASYVKRKTSPMEYALGATNKMVENSLNYEQAKQHIFDIEERFNVHGQQLKLRLEEQALKRQQSQKERR